jgi:hypothetical protein
MDTLVAPPAGSERNRFFFQRFSNVKPDHKNKEPRHVAVNPWNLFISYKIP